MTVVGMVLWTAAWHIGDSRSLDCWCSLTWSVPVTVLCWWNTREHRIPLELGNWWAHGSCGPNSGRTLVVFDDIALSCWLYFAHLPETISSWVQFHVCWVLLLCKLFCATGSVVSLFPVLSPPLLGWSSPGVGNTACDWTSEMHCLSVSCVSTCWC